MMTQTTPSLSSLLTLYIHMRQRGRSMDEVVKELQEDAYRLPRDERRKLSDLVVEWEKKSSNQYSEAKATPTPTPPSAPKAATVQPSPAVTTNPPPVSSKVFGTRLLDPSKLPTAKGVDQLVPCPRCKTPGLASKGVCQECGQSLVPGVTTTHNLSEGTLSKKPPVDLAIFTPGSMLLFSIKGKANLEAYPREPILIGRNDAKSIRMVTLDLSPYDGEALGVSRVHAEIRPQNNTLVLVDMGSMNGTYVNELRLYPHEVRVLRSGDEVRLGKLTLKITYKLA